MKFFNNTFDLHSKIISKNYRMCFSVNSFVWKDTFIYRLWEMTIFSWHANLLLNVLELYQDLVVFWFTCYTHFIVLKTTFTLIIFFLH